ncbi:hypothetical protein QQ045_001298 [Rhodiola kirilowii]
MDCFLPSRGRIASRSIFSFIRYRTMTKARAAIRRLHGTMVGNRRLVVMLADNEGKPKDFKQNVGRPIKTLEGKAMTPEYELKEWKPKHKERSNLVMSPLKLGVGKKSNWKEENSN